MFVVISYDIRSDKRRNRVFKTLKNFGQWMQYSVFECESRQNKLGPLKRPPELNLIRPSEDDSVRSLFFVRDTVKQQVKRIGGEKPRKEGAVIV